MPHLSPKGAGSGRLPGLPCPQGAKGMGAGMVPVTGTPAHGAGHLPAGQGYCRQALLVLLTLGMAVPGILRLLTGCFRQTGVCVS